MKRHRAQEVVGRRRLVSVPGRADLHDGRADRAAADHGADGARRRVRGSRRTATCWSFPTNSRWPRKSSNGGAKCSNSSGIKVKEQMASKRLELSHLEEHIRELERRWRELQDAAADLQRRIQGQDAGQEASRGRTGADCSRKSAPPRRRSRPPRARWPSGRRRMRSFPMTDPMARTVARSISNAPRKGVILQPEGIVLGAKDFDGPLGPGNPLDAALRGIREYYAQAGLLGSKGEPYPLLIVRPGGVEAYAAARSAMRTWDDEFGYELVDETMQLKYPDPDPALSQLLHKVVSTRGPARRSWRRPCPAALDAVRMSASSPHRRPAALFRKADAGGPQGGPRTGGFGRGGDSRFADGQSIGSVAGEASPMTPADSRAGRRRRAAPRERRRRKSAPGSRRWPRRAGENWGLPQRTANATGIVRPMRIACLPDRLIILPDRGESRAPDIVLVEGGMYDEIDSLISKIWSRVEEWGIAVAGGYWKPVLNVHVTQGADARFDELRVLLDGSGLEVRRMRQVTRRFREQAEAPGQDSFLDVVCNLVGIMIILVMIVGTRVKGAMLSTESTPDPVARSGCRIPAQRRGRRPPRTGHDARQHAAPGNRNCLSAQRTRSDPDVHLDGGKRAGTGDEQAQRRTAAGPRTASQSVGGTAPAGRPENGTRGGGDERRPA